MGSALLAWDAAIQGWFASWPRSPALDEFMVALSMLGWRGAIFVALAAGFAIRRRGLAVMGAWRVVLAVVLSVTTVVGIWKPLFGRERPLGTMPGVSLAGTRTTGHSFPSGHASDAVAGAYALSLLWPRRRRSWWTLAVLICVSRLYLGVHYPLDIAAGAAWGLACAYFATAGTRARITAGQPRAA